ncbi:MAG: 5-formyltetrahydrofolate cyclo-ligase [Betaproteobacteria bacterium]|nr:5-formyltetrahydrofolate cyclo-ligase [Betaproteobacteria bacterium]
MEFSKEVAPWRKAKRAELLEQRRGVDPGVRHGWNERITALLVEGFPLLRGMAVSFYWPFQGEFDPRFAIHHWRQQGAVAALPVVVEKGTPLQFREWWPGVATEKGVFDLPVPQGTAVLTPQASLIPPIGFDGHGYRLGYGGGYFDRTLAQLGPQPLKIAVAFELSRIDSIRPQPHDIPMDFVVTEAGIQAVTGEGLVRIADPAEAGERARRILQERREQAAGLGDEEPLDVRPYASPPCYAALLDPAYKDV